MSVFIPATDVRPAQSRPARNVSYLLINPPMSDPTTPYHSIPYLVGPAREAGYGDYRCLDANLDALEYLTRPEQVDDLLQHAESVIADVALERRPTRRDEIRFRQALAARALSRDMPAAAIELLRDPERFYHYPSYASAVSVINRWLELLALRLPIGIMDGFRWHSKSEANLCSTKDLSDDAVIRSISAPFEPYLADEFTMCLRERPWDVVGLSVNYTSQLPVALRIADIVKKVRPDAVIVFGGTEVGDVVKYTRDKAALWRVFKNADLLVPGEGETVFVSILDAVGTGGELGAISGAISRGTSEHTISYVNVASLAAPAYDVWDWGRYWSPEPVVLYSPTRGCYWNKCTFCDYGLNSDKPTSPSRERPVPTVLDDLTAVSAFAKVVYFSVDAMSPRYLKTLAGELADAGAPVRWSAELRLERTWPKRAMGELLRDSGCVAVSFGYESGVQRVLDLIDKGVKVDQIPEVLAELRRNGIAAQMMGFTGFPTETAEEAEQTYRFLHEHGELWTLAGIGSFILTPGAIVAKQPDRFGIELLPSSPSDDISRYVPWRDRTSGTERWADTVDERVSDELRDRLQRPGFSIPFVGGIDSTHSLLYFARYGTELLGRGPDRSGQTLLKGAAFTVPFASVEALTTVEQFTEEVARRTRQGLDTTTSGFADWLAEPGGAVPGKSSVIMAPSGSIIELPADVDLDRDDAQSKAIRAVAAAIGTSR